MTKNNTLDEILYTLAMSVEPDEEGVSQFDNLEDQEQAGKEAIDKAKQQIAQAIEDAKPEEFKFEDGKNDATHFFNKAIEEYHQNLLKELGLTNNKENK